MPAKTILVIDDEPMIREVARIALAMVGGHHVLMADGGEAGMAMARSERPDAILLDWQMPGLDGLETLDRLQADPSLRAVPVVMLTGSTREAEARGPIAHGAVGVIAKPFEASTLARTLAGVLGWGASGEGC